MKFAVFCLLFSTAEALRVVQKPEYLVKVPMSHHNMMKKFIKTTVGSKAKDLPPDLESDLEAWAEKQLTTGEGTITKAEADTFFSDWATKHGVDITP